MKLDEDIQLEDVKTCLFCRAVGVTRYAGMRDKLFGAAGIWSISYCRNCDLSWLDPRPIRRDLAKIYQSYYTHEPVRSGSSILVSLKNKVERILLKAEFGYDSLPGGTGARFAGRLLGALLPMAREIAGSSVMWLNAQSKGKLLDVGCGNGSFLATMQALGWDVAGVEPDAKSARIATEELGLSVTASTLEDANFPPDCFDCVTAHHTIEHMHEPVEFLRESFRILKPGGRLVVTTPSVPSFAHRIFRRCWRGLEPPRHLYLFSPHALGICVERIGFRLDVLRTTARSAWEIWYASRLIRRDGKVPHNFRDALNLRLRFEGLVFQLFQHLMLRFNSNIGEQIVLMASKPL
jgi:2-polyprenyl-3-methyl-5-hydroxy-6-metoxy-1,4-benzoquinol methylase